MKIQFGLDGEAVDTIDSNNDSFTDPGTGSESRYTEEQKLAAAATVSPADAKHSPQQIQIDRQVNHIKFLEAKAVAITGYNDKGEPQYVETAIERAKLQKIAGMERENLKLSHALAELSLGEDALNKANEAAALQQQEAEHAALQERARAIAFENQAQELAKLFAPKASRGSGLKIN